jgi:hypothetical protein
LESFVETLLREQQRRVDRLIRIGATAAARRAYGEAIADLQARLAAQLRKGKGSGYSAHVQRVLLIQLREGVDEMTRKLGAQLALTSAELQVESTAAAIGFVKSMEQHYTGAMPVLPVEQASVFWGVIDGVAPSLLSSHQASVQRYGRRLIGTMQSQLSQSVLTGETGYAAMRRMETVAKVNWWQAERIVRTECAYAYNATHVATNAAMAETMPDLWNRWTELVDDTTGKPFDDRVAGDSLALHGQVVPATGGMFTMPVDPRASPKLWGKQWTYPPNRPNDRSTVIPWRLRWGDVPAWRYTGGHKEWMGKDSAIPVRQPDTLDT